MFTTATITLVLAVMDKVAIGFGGLGIAAISSGKVMDLIDSKKIVTVRKYSKN